jgi:hypothetical protein
MSANYDEKDQILTSAFIVNKVDEELLGMIFDSHVDWYIYDQQERIREIKALKRVCLIKTIVFIPEIVFSWWFYKQYAKERIQTQKQYWKFLRNKITLDEFKNELNYILRNSKLG